MMMLTLFMMQLMEMPIPKDGDEDVYDHTCDIADLVGQGDDGVGEDDDNDDDDAEGNDDGGDDDDDDDKPLASIEHLAISSEYALT
jgi:hypothetical protein